MNYFYNEEIKILLLSKNNNKKEFEVKKIKYRIAKIINFCLRNAETVTVMFISKQLFELMGLEICEAFKCFYGNIKVDIFNGNEKEVMKFIKQANLVVTYAKLTNKENKILEIAKQNNILILNTNSQLN